MAEEKKKKKKAEKVSINLPKARASMKRRFEMAQFKTNNEDMWKFISGAIIVLIVLFIIMGGINQRAAWNWCKNFGETVGKKISSFFNPDDIVVNDDGVYWKPGTGEGATTESTDGSSDIGSTENKTDTNTEQTNTEQNTESSTNSE